jgi:hypothetical protein
LNSAYDTFLEWNPDKNIAEAAEKLYNDIEHLELYVGEKTRSLIVWFIFDGGSLGLQAEESKPVVKGAGLCPGNVKSFPSVLFSNRSCRIHYFQSHSS